MKQGPFALGGLCCPARRHYYGPLRLPLGCRPFPRCSGYRKARSWPPQGQGRVGPLQFLRQPSGRSTSPTPGGSSAPAPGSQAHSMAFAKSTQARLLLALLTQESLTTLQTSLHVADRSVVPPRSRPRPLGRPWGLRYRGPWRLPGPDLHRLVTASLSLGYVMPTPLQSWRPSCWTHVVPGFDTHRSRRCTRDRTAVVDMG